MQESPSPNLPWWRHAEVWLLLAGPATVVIAGVLTAIIAFRDADPVVAVDYYRRGMEINKEIAQRDKALLPAQQGRNHAATPTRP